MKDTLFHGQPDAPQWARDLLAEVKALKREDVIEKIKARLPSFLENVPKKFYAGREFPEREEDLQAFVDKVKADYAEFKKELVGQGLMSNNPPAGGGSGVEKADNVEADIAAWANKRNGRGASSQISKKQSIDLDIEKWAQSS